MNAGGESIRVVHPLFQTEGGGSTPTSPLQLSVGEISLEKAIQLNAIWHSRLPEASASNMQRVARLMCFGAEHDGLFYASAIWTDPVARLLNGRGMLELRRFAIAPDAPRNTASRVLRVMRQMIERRFSDTTTLISYQDTEVHTGCIYRAAGWVAVNTSDGGEWSRPSRSRSRVQASSPKVRWEYVL